MGRITLFHSVIQSPPQARHQSRKADGLLTPVMDAALTRLAWKRAKSCCEYWWMPRCLTTASLEGEHIIACMVNRRQPPLFKLPLLS